MLKNIYVVLWIAVGLIMGGVTLKNTLGLRFDDLPYAVWAWPYFVSLLVTPLLTIVFLVRCFAFRPLWKGELVLAICVFSVFAYNVSRIGTS